MSASIATHRFPSAIEGKLRSVRWRHAALAASYALAFGCCVLIVLMILSMAIDWAIPFTDLAVRVFLTAGTLVATVATVALLGFKPIGDSLRWKHAASAVDQEVPQLEERWSTVASLSARDQTNESPMQKAMAAQVTSEAIAMEKVVQPWRVAPPVSLRPALYVAAASAILLAGLVMISPAQMSVLLKRFWSPTSTITATQLTSETGDRFVPRGESIQLVTKLSGLPRSQATLTVQDSDGMTQDYRLRCDKQAPDQFLHTMRVDDSLSYRVRAGDGQTEWQHLRVIDFPEVAEVDFSIDFPEYTDRERISRDRIPRRIKVIQGSTLNLSLKPAEPLKVMRVSLAKPDQTSRSTQSDSETPGERVRELVADKDGWYHFQMQLIDDVLLRPTLISAHGLENQRRLFSRIEVIADKAPVARVIGPTDEMAVSVDDKIEIEFEAHDDHGIATAELVVFDESQKDADGNPRVVDVKEIPLGDQRMQKHVMGKTQLDLKQLNVAEGSEISYAIRVTDNRIVQLSGEVPVQPNSEFATQNSNETKTPAGPDVTGSTGDADPKVAQQTDTRKASVTAGNPRQDANKAPGDGAHDGRQDGVQIADKDEMPGKTSGSVPGEQLGDDRLAKLLELMPESSETKSMITSQSLGQSDAVDQDDQRHPPSPMNPISDAGQLAAKDSDSTRNQADPTEAASAGTQPGQTPSAKNNLVRNHSRPSSDSDAVQADGQRDPKDPSPRGDQVKDGMPELDAAEAKVSKSSDPKEAATAANSDSSQNDSTNNDSSNNDESRSRVSNQTSTPTDSKDQTPQPPSKYSLTGQRNRSGQNTLTGRRRLKITEKLASIAEAEQRPGEDRQIRESVVEIDEMLADVESGVRQLVQHKIADADRAEQFRRLDTGLGNIESYVADLREQTKENQFAFVGLQMVDITRTHVTPARDRVFSAIQRPNASDVDASASLQHVVRARELLGALLKRYDRVVQERKLQRSLDETVTMYEVYVQKRRMLMRETRQNINPLQRKMAVIEVDQAYLDRLAEVLKLRREMMEEFAQMLGDDPRLLSRYLELVKRRGKSLRDQLTEISQRQYDATEESLSWLQIDQSQKQDLWAIISELRLHSATDMAKDAAELAERIEKQMPLEVDAQVGTPAEVIRQAKKIATTARAISFDADKLIANAGQVTDRSSLIGHARSLVANCDRLSALLDRLQFENESEEAIADYVEPRMLETRTVADQADAWSILSESLVSGDFSGLVRTEQYRLAVTTQFLRVEMLDMENDLDGQFRQLTDSSVPGDIVDRIRTLHRLMETITFNQAAASFRADQGQLESAAQQQQLATERLEEAEKLFDQIRRAVVEKLDEYEATDPNIADLRDPTLDEFLARLEREPNIASQLGIPNRRSNLRIIADSMLWQQNGQGGLGGSGEAAAERANAAMKMKMNRAKKKDQEPERETSEEEQENLAEAKKAQQMLEKSLVEIEKQRDDPKTPDDQRQRLKKLAEDVKKMLKDATADPSDREAWQKIVQSDQAKALIEAIARGEAIPDQQWNKLLSTLEDGLWQVRGNQPPEAYRKAIEQYQDQIRELMQTIDEG